MSSPYTALVAFLHNQGNPSSHLPLRGVILYNLPIHPICQPDKVEEYSPINRRILYEEMEKNFFQVIMADLFTKDFEWSIQKPEGRISFPDMTINIDHDGYKKWYLEFKGSLHGERIVSYIRYVLPVFSVIVFHETVVLPKCYLFLI